MLLQCQIKGWTCKLSNLMWWILMKLLIYIKSITYWNQRHVNISFIRKEISIVHPFVSNINLKIQQFKNPLKYKKQSWYPLESQFSYDLWTQHVSFFVHLTMQLPPPPIVKHVITKSKQPSTNSYHCVVFQYPCTYHWWYQSNANISIQH